MNKQQTFRSVQQAFDMLGNPLRFAIFMNIAREGCDCDLESQQGYAGNCVTGIMRELKIPQSTESSYINDLVSWGLIECKKNGKFLYCKPKKETLIAMKSVIDSCLLRAARMAKV